MARNCCLKSSRVGGSARSLTPAAGTTTLIDPVADGPEPESPVGLAELGHLGGDLLRRHTHFHLAHQRLVPRGLAGEADAEQFAHRAARAVTADEIARTQPFPVGQLDGHALVVLLETGHRATAPDLRAQLDRMLFEQADDDRLRDAQQIGVRGVQARGRGLVDGGEEAAGRTLSSVFENALQQPAHRHQLDAADVQADDADERRGLGFLLQDEYPHVVQPQLGGQHRAGRPAPGDDHVEDRGSRCMVLPFGSAWLARRSRRHLRQSPDRDGKGEHPHRYSVHGSHLLGRCRGQPQATSPSNIASSQ